MDMVNRFDVYFVDLNPTLGSEINKVRPCVIISPNEMNKALNTVIIAPLTSTIKKYPMRVCCYINDKEGQIALDHIRSLDKQRLKNKIATLDKKTQLKVIDKLIAMFCE
ncbi:type II toxin-antitoxin system PemK/MazF family toxin [Ornithobacterium rhinotracheale]|nr:type II toxin-antitoxin system PemK/MazF family toxin [Ornithobacterium rhinotracheale]MRJ09064.1 type II toxin-antitoxin system PemK/MazF family toxin [Ornithobacterium rhinotracheale]MRJ09686.1 type II toxin-antitoxin system PemK/MazF family toxin [Ornithobacterium rhinotracheale]